MASTIERPRMPAGQPTRRALLAGAALVAPAVMLPAIAAAAEPDPHPAWFAEWQACQAIMDGPAGATVDCLSELPACHRARELERLAAATPARTLAGAVAQLRLAWAFMDVYGPLGDGVNDDALIENALATLERLAGGAAA